MRCAGLLPNKRLKLAGAYRSKGSGVLCPWRGTDYRPATLRRLACRPQLKRDPLGGALPPDKHSSVNSFGTVIPRGAERRCSRGTICSPRPTPHGRATGAPRRAPPSVGWLPIGKFSTQSGAATQPRAARSSLGAKRAV